MDSVQKRNAGRRHFLKALGLGGLHVSFMPVLFGNNNKQLDYSLELKVATRLFDGKKCWSHPRAGIIPGAIKNGIPKVVMTMNSLDLAGSDVFYGMFGLFSDDLSESWSDPVELKSMSPIYEVIDGQKRPVAVSDFWPRWHSASKTLLGTGHTVAYTPDWKVRNPRPRHTSYSVFDVEKGTWKNWKKLKMPVSEKFYNSGAGCTQRFDLENGTILLPISFKPQGRNARITVCKCNFDGERMEYIEHGTELELNDDSRGLGEPSITRFRREYFLTIRNDRKGFVARSKDGLKFDGYKPWKFDDGTELGSYNTQQHWVTHSDDLYLVYTRRGANNDHVFRHRAPLFMARVDTDELCVIKGSEQVLVPERGARLGNFGITDVSDSETWVTVAEWMQPHGVEKYGSDGSVFVAKIKWNKPNKLFRK